MQGELKLTIELDAAPPSEDFQIAAALNQAAAKVFSGAREGAITADGKTVGKFELIIERAEPQEVD